MNSERKFIEELEAKARSQQKLVQTELIPAWARGVGGWLAVNPWRALVPMACILYLILRFVMGTQYRDFVLGLFGGFK